MTATPASPASRIAPGNASTTQDHAVARPSILSPSDTFAFFANDVPNGASALPVMEMVLLQVAAAN